MQRIIHISHDQPQMSHYLTHVHATFPRKEFCIVHTGAFAGDGALAGGGATLGGGGAATAVGAAADAGAVAVEAAAGFGAAGLPPPKKERMSAAAFGAEIDICCFQDEQFEASCFDRPRERL